MSSCKSVGAWRPDRSWVPVQRPRQAGCRSAGPADRPCACCYAGCAAAGFLRRLASEGNRLRFAGFIQCHLDLHGGVDVGVLVRRRHERGHGGRLRA
uniref:Uncharacterized protein n=1 Tax=Triticum urartu TaxID=4572 RepID=A0A8R7QTG0_TRIUA